MQSRPSRYSTLGPRYCWKTFFHQANCGFPHWLGVNKQRGEDSFVLCVCSRTSPLHIFLLLLIRNTSLHFILWALSVQLDCCLSSTLVEIGLLKSILVLPCWSPPCPGSLSWCGLGKSRYLKSKHLATRQHARSNRNPLPRSIDNCRLCPQLLLQQINSACEYYNHQFILYTERKNTVLLYSRRQHARTHTLSNTSNACLPGPDLALLTSFLSAADLCTVFTPKTPPLLCPLAGWELALAISLLIFPGTTQSLSPRLWGYSLTQHTHRHTRTHTRSHPATRHLVTRQFPLQPSHSHPLSRSLSRRAPCSASNHPFSIDKPARPPAIRRCPHIQHSNLRVYPYEYSVHSPFITLPPSPSFSSSSSNPRRLSWSHW